MPAAWKAGSPWKEGQPRDAEIKQNFWEIFDDPVLTGLEQEATTNSPDLRAAFERVEQSRAVARIIQGGPFPRLELRSQWEPHALFGKAGPRNRDRSSWAIPANDFVLPLDLSYEVDLWGRVRRSFRAAREQAQASAAAYQNVLLSLQADVAQTYFMIRSIDLDRHVVAETIELRKKNLTLVESLHQGGADSAVDVAQAQTELASAEADLVGLELQRAQLENALAVLCGQTSSSFSLAETDRLYQPPEIPVGLPADLLERRPDVAEAERSMAAASEGIGIAKAAFFPSIQLTGTAGVESAELKDIFNWENRIWSIGPNISLPLFEGGRNRAGVAARQGGLPGGRGAIPLAGLGRIPRGGGRLGRLAPAQGTIRGRKCARWTRPSKVADLSRHRYKEGLASYFEVVLADRTALENQILAYRIERPAHRDDRPVDQGAGRRLESGQRHDDQKRDTA